MLSADRGAIRGILRRWRSAPVAPGLGGDDFPSRSSLSARPDA